MLMQTYICDKCGHTETCGEYEREPMRSVSIRTNEDFCRSFSIHLCNACMTQLGMSKMSKPAERKIPDVLDLLATEIKRRLEEKANG